VPIEENRMADSLAVAASTFKPPLNPRLRYEIEIRHKPSIPDNVKHWQMFEDEEHIKYFLELVGEFSGLEIDQEEEVEEEHSNMKILKVSVGNHKILQLKDNVIPKGLVPLEKLFNANDVGMNPKKADLEEDLEECNLGTDQQPKMVRLAKNVPEHFKQRYVSLFKKFVDVFAWSYEDLKTYDTKIIQHKIPLKPRVKSFR